VITSFLSPVSFDKMTKLLFTSDQQSSFDTHQLRDAFIGLANDCLSKQQAHDSQQAGPTDHVELLEQKLGKGVCRRLGIYRLPEGFLLSVVIPVYNEAATVENVLQRVRDVGLPCEMVIVDDGSQDGTRDVLKRLEEADDVKVVLHEKNQGKGAALKTGFTHVKGDVVVVQDADKEYDPRDLLLLLEPLLDDRADVVYGSRFSAGDRSVSPSWHRGVNGLITKLSNFRTRLRFTDVETCYKVFRRALVEEFAPTLQERGFGVELEMTAKLAKMKDIRFHERPISYDRRSYAEGKKIGWRDGVWALWCIMRY